VEASHPITLNSSVLGEQKGGLIRDPGPFRPLEDWTKVRAEVWAIIEVRDI
jgi:hypothetical protein